MTTAMIIGGGIAGTVTAIALQKAGIRTAVYEARPADATDDGTFLLVSANGMAALRAIGAHRPVLDNSFPANRLDFVSSTGKRLGARQLAGEDADGLGPRTLRRDTLCRVLREEAEQRGIRVEHGKRFLAAHTAPDGHLVVSFADGGRAQADLLVGADGTHSAIRRFVDAASPRPRFAGQTTVCGRTRDAAQPPAPDAFTMIYGKRAFFGCTLAPNGEVWWFANAPGPELPRKELAAVTAEQWRDRVADLFAHDDTPAADLVRAADDCVTGYPAYDIASTPTWFREATVIVGDAAHPAAPNAAQGASLAMEDGVVLGKCLRELQNPRRAFRAYERLRRARVERAVAASAELARRNTPGPVGRVLRDAVLPRRLGRAGAGAGDWLTDYRVDWDEPVAEALAALER
jgi:2-polyprenyl-6-methoxyphenol hydroxylase-like FAD-dependent oxidoreductase